MLRRTTSDYRGACRPYGKTALLKFLVADGSRAAPPTGVRVMNRRSFSKVSVVVSAGIPCESNPSGMKSLARRVWRGLVAVTDGGSGDSVATGSVEVAREIQNLTLMPRADETSSPRGYGGAVK